MFLRNMKIRSKLFIAFGLFIVLMMVSSGLSLFSLDRANSGMQNIITNDYPITVKANKLIDGRRGAVDPDVPEKARHH